MNIWEFFSLNEPDGPKLPWGNPTLDVLDTMRLIVLFLGVLCLLITPSIVRRATVLGQKIRFLGCTLFSVIAILTEYNHLGDYTHWRLAVNFFATICTTWGYWSFFRWESGPTYSNRLRD